MTNSTGFPIRAGLRRVWRQPPEIDDFPLTSICLNKEAVHLAGKTAARQVIAICRPLIAHSRRRFRNTRRAISRVEFFAWRSEAADYLGIVLSENFVAPWNLRSRRPIPDVRLRSNRAVYGASRCAKTGHWQTGHTLNRPHAAAFGVTAQVCLSLGRIRLKQIMRSLHGFVIFWMTREGALCPKFGRLRRS